MQFNIIIEIDSVPCHMRAEHVRRLHCTLSLFYVQMFYFKNWLLLHLRPNYIHSASNDIHTDGPRATARARG